MNEADFLQRIQKRQSATINHRPAHPGKYPGPVRTLPDNLVDEFSRQLTAVGGHVYVVSDAASAQRQLGAIVEELRRDGNDAATAVVTGHAILRDLELDALLSRLDVAAYTIPHASFLVQNADLGLTGAEYAVAASGTIAMAASSHHPRSASLLPPIHIAVIRQEQLLPDLAALAERIRHDFPERPSSGFALITGPSRTADIEQTLSIGVHGPGKLYVMMLSS